MEQVPFQADGEASSLVPVTRESGTGEDRGKILALITDPLKLLALFLLVVESLIALWLVRAESVTERIAAGMILLAIFVSFMIVLVRITPRGGPSQTSASQAITIKSLPEPVTPAKNDVTIEEIRDPKTGEIAGPDGSFVINAPPDTWSTREVTPSEFIAETLRITDKGMREQIIGNLEESRTILAMEAPEEMKVVPIPGTTEVDGRRYPTAMGFTIPTQLSIFTIERAGPVFFAARPFEHGFFRFLTESKATQVLGMEKFRVETVGSKRRIVAEFRQQIRNAVVNGEPGVSIDNNIVLIGIEGELQDHLLMMKYPKLSERPQSQLEANLRTLQALVNSFRPLRVINPSQAWEALKGRWDKAYDEFIRRKAEDLFGSELYLVLARVKGLDLDNPQERMSAIDELAPFEGFAKSYALDDEDLKDLWDSLKRAREGDARDFKKEIKSLLAELEEEKSSSASA